MAHDVELVEDERASGRLRVTELRNGFHMSITPVRCVRSFSAPDRRRSGRGQPPCVPRRRPRSGRPRSRSLTMTGSCDPCGWRSRRCRWRAGGYAGAGHLLLHVEVIEILHRAMVQALHFGVRVVRHVPAQLALMQGKALGVARVLCQPVAVCYMHATASRVVERQRTFDQ